MEIKTDRFPLCPILLADDDIHSLRSFDFALRSGGFNHTLRCQDSREVLPILEKQEIDLILLDLLMPNVSGEEILSAAVRDFPEIPVIMVSGMNEVDTAVRCMHRGAFDYVLKPVEQERLLHGVRRAVEVRQLRRENASLTRRFIADSPARPDIFSRIITRNRKMQKIFRYCEAVAEGFHPILITGETGVGKELIAGAIHDLSGRQGNFVVVNVAGLDDNMFSDTLFGHTRGAFTGAETLRQGLVEKAAGGTLLLDEIGDLSEASQLKLLRLIEQREYFPLGSDTAKPSTARFLTATHKDIENLKKGKSFRADLYYRLCTHHIHIPPLRERPDDIPPLFDCFLDRAAREMGKKKPAYHPDILTLLATYSFPGNIRELKAMVFDAMGKHQSKMFSSESFKDHIRKFQRIYEISGKEISSSLLSDPDESWAARLDPLPTLKDASQVLIREAMKRANDNQRVAALLLGISPQALSQRLRRFIND